MWALLLACHRLEKVAPFEDRACEDPILEPLAGYSTDEPALATAHAETYGAAPDPYQIHLSWSSDASTSQSVIWRTDADTLANRVQYGEDTTYGEDATGGSFLAGTDTVNGRNHEVHLCGLKPGTTYHYRVGGEAHWSSDYTFTTAPEPGTLSKFRFVIAGDSRDNQTLWAQLVQEAEKSDPDFYLFSGDMVDIGVNMTEWDAWMNAFSGVSEYKPVMTVHGNHEFLTRQYFGFFALPGNEQWYSFDYGQLHVVGLNDTVAQATDIDTQATWMAQDLDASDAPLKVVFHHIPAYTSCTTHPPDLNIQQKWSPVEEQKGVVIDFTGHNHNYERSYPLSQGQPVDASIGTTYIVAAGAGANLYDNDLSQPYTQVASVSWHYVVVDVDGGTISTTAYDLAGNVLDQFSASR